MLLCARVSSCVYFCFLCMHAVSEPTLKWKLKKLISTRPNPLQRKISAPPAVRHRTETFGRRFAWRHLMRLFSCDLLFCVLHSIFV